MDEAMARANAVLAAQAGLAHRAQLRRAGLAGSRIAARIESGSWSDAGDGVVSVAGAAASFDRGLWHAVLAVGTRDDGTARPVAVGSRAAAALHGLFPEPAAVEVVVPRRRWAPRPAATAVREVSDWSDRRFTRVRGLLVTALPDTLVDIAPYLDDAAYLTLLQDACFANSALLGRVLARCHRGSKGSARARRMAAELARGFDSPLHRRAVAILRAAALPPDACDAEAVPGAGPSDCLYVAGGRPAVALELDGDVHRLSRAAFLHDRAKDLVLREAGCVTLRFTVEQVERPGRLVSDVRRALAAAGHELAMRSRRAGVA